MKHEKGTLILKNVTVLSQRTVIVKKKRRGVVV